MNGAVGTLEPSSTCKEAVEKTIVWVSTVNDLSEMRRLMGMIK